MQDDGQARLGYVLGLDPGWRNLGLALVRADGQVEEMAHYDVYCGAPWDARSVHSNLFRVLAKYRDYPLQAVVIEEQFDNSACLSRIEGFLAGLFWDSEVWVVPPRHLKTKFYLKDRESLLMGRHGANKKAAMDWVREQVEMGLLTGADTDMTDRLARSAYSDHEADALLQAMYVLSGTAVETYKCNKA